MATLKPHSNGPLYSNTPYTVSGTLAVDGWAVHLVQRGGGAGRAAAPPSTLLAVPNVASSPSVNVQCTNFILFDVAPWLPLHSKELIKTFCDQWHNNCPAYPATQGAREGRGPLCQPPKNVVWYMVNWLLVVNFMLLKLIRDRQTKLVIYYDYMY